MHICSEKKQLRLSEPYFSGGNSTWSVAVCTAHHTKGHIGMMVYLRELHYRGRTCLACQISRTMNWTLWSPPSPNLKSTGLLLVGWGLGHSHWNDWMATTLGKWEHVDLAEDQVAKIHVVADRISTASEFWCGSLLFTRVKWKNIIGRHFHYLFWVFCWSEREAIYDFVMSLFCTWNFNVDSLL